MRTEPKRSTITFEPEVYRFVRAQADELHLSLSEVVNRLLQERLAEDLEDLAAIEQTGGEETISFDDFVADLRGRGRL